MKVALCCIGRLENQYAVEFVEWYKKLGFDKIFIYDNNHDGEEYFEDVLQSYIDDGFVEIINYRNLQAAQLMAYNNCYQNHGNEYDWIAFFDFDEFLTLVKDKDIKSYLSHFDGFQGVKINWMVYTDSNLIKSDGRGVLERFTTPMEYDKCVTYKFPENYHVKSILRTRNGFVWNGTPHNINGAKYADSDGNETNDSPFQKYSYESAYIKHFTTKTIEEFINGKYKKGTADRDIKSFKNTTYGSIDSFFKVNERTKEKDEYINSIIKPIDNLDIFIGTQKTFTPAVKNDAYKIIVGNHEIENNSNLELINCKHDSVLDDRFYSEIYMLDYISKNYPLKEYVGFCHNRRYFSFLDDIPDMDEIFSECDLVAANPRNSKINMREEYKTFHNIDDLNIVENIIDEKYPEYRVAFRSFLYGKTMFPYNMVIMKREDFLRYIKFIKDVLDDYLNIVGTDINKRIEENKDKYLKDFYPNNTVEYQYRIGGYLAERLTTVFIYGNFKHIKPYDVIITENKYNKEKKQ